MGDGIYVAAAGAVAQSNALDVTANNVANASTTGFRGTRVTFAEALARARSPDVALVGGITPAVDLQPGRYIATCFLPKGATSMDTMQSAEGEPHAALGMVQEFTVA